MRTNNVDKLPAKVVFNRMRTLKTFLYGGKVAISTGEIAKQFRGIDAIELAFLLHSMECSGLFRHIYGLINTDGTLGPFADDPRKLTGPSDSDIGVFLVSN